MVTKLIVTFLCHYRLRRVKVGLKEGGFKIQTVKNEFLTLLGGLGGFGDLEVFIMFKKNEKKVDW